jgi:double-stranded uracil-DNA glycosylase
VKKFCLEPVVDDNTEILILGTLPSDKSLEAQQYYTNPSNDFWRLLGAVLKLDLKRQPYAEKIRTLKAHRIGLWDAFHTCARPGSMDKDITDQELNDFKVLRSLAAKISLICFNGQGATEAEVSLIRLGYTTCHLPSSSSANRKDQTARRLKWQSAIQK